MCTPPSPTQARAFMELAYLENASPCMSHTRAQANTNHVGLLTSVRGAEEVHRTPAEGTTKTGAPKEHFGHGHAARVEAGKKGAEISSSRSEEARKEAARKARPPFTAAFAALPDADGLPYPRP